MLALYVGLMIEIGGLDANANVVLVGRAPRNGQSQGVCFDQVLGLMLLFVDSYGKIWSFDCGMVSQILIHLQLAILL